MKIWCFKLHLAQVLCQYLDFSEISSHLNYFPVSNIRPWSLIFFRVKPPCGHPYFSMVAYFFEVCVPIWSFNIIWSLIDFPGQKKFQGECHLLCRRKALKISGHSLKLANFPIWSGRLLKFRNFPFWSDKKAVVAY